MATPAMSCTSCAPFDSSHYERRLFETRYWIVALDSNQERRGRTLFICRRHVNTHQELTSQEVSSAARLAVRLMEAYERLFNAKFDFIVEPSSSHPQFALEPKVDGMAKLRDRMLKRLISTDNVDCYHLIDTPISSTVAQEFREREFRQIAGVITAVIMHAFVVHARL